MTRLHYTSLLAGLTLSAVLLAPLASAQTNMSFSHTLPANHPAHTTGFTVWAESIEQATEGEVSFSFFPAGQMGVGRDQFEMVQNGIVDVAWFNPGHTPGRFPIISAVEVPFLVGDGLAGSKAIDEWYREHAAVEMPNVYYCLTHTHEPGIIHSRQEIKRPADLRGMRIRPANATLAQVLQAQGGSSIQVGPSEAREVLARRTADGITFPWRSIFVFGMEDFVKYHIDIPLYAPTFVIAINQSKYNRLSDKNKAAIDAHCNSEWAVEITKGWSEYDLEGKDILLEAADHNVYTPTDEQIEEWRQISNPIIASWKSTVNATGADADAIYQQLLDSLEASNALY
ncbi:MAG: TRAP transporter substrate-binding protein [Saccharospirillum sp.]|nr:TRAP transporter substrate-binding protein [Saccharospirillum sp.]